MSSGRKFNEIKGLEGSVHVSDSCYSWWGVGVNLASHGWEWFNVKPLGRDGLVLNQFGEGENGLIIKP